METMMSMQQSWNCSALISRAHFWEPSHDNLEVQQLLLSHAVSWQGGPYRCRDPLKKKYTHQSQRPVYFSSKVILVNGRHIDLYATVLNLLCCNARACCSEPSDNNFEVQQSLIRNWLTWKIRNVLIHLKSWPSGRHNHLLATVFELLGSNCQGSL